MDAFRKMLDVYKTSKDSRGIPEFVGYGNPYANVLIIGQENTIQNDEDEKTWDKFHKDNCQQWIETIDMNLRAHELSEYPAETDYKFPIFNPRNPFFPKQIVYQESHTWFYYQKIMDIVCPHSGNLYNMFDHCFITEMSDICSPHNPNIPDVEKSIAHRFDLMKQTKEFWSHFKIVIFACGHYADAIQNKEKFPTLYIDMFGDAYPYFTHQLSQASDDEIKRIQDFIKEKLCS